MVCQEEVDGSEVNGDITPAGRHVHRCSQSYDRMDKPFTTRRRRKAVLTNCCRHELHHNSTEGHQPV